MKKLILSTAMSAALATSAMAADMASRVYTKAPPPQPIYDWTGFYLGANVGFGVSQAHVFNAVPAFPDSPNTSDRSGTGFAGGVQAGFNWQFAPSWVAGIEGDIGYLGIDRSVESFPGLGLGLGLGLGFGAKTDWYGTVRGRLGYSSGPSLFYATGGAAFVNVKNNADDNALLASTSATKSGWTAGAGIETMLGGNWSAKAEYLYIDVGSQTVTNAGLPADFGYSSKINFENQFHVLRYGLNYKFGGSVIAMNALPVAHWTGFYLGANAGAGLSQTHATAASEGTVFNVTDLAGTGFAGGLQAGYNWQFNPNWVAGIEGDFGRLGIERSVMEGLELFGVKTDWYSTVRGRIGYSTGPALLYVTGGAAFVNVRNTSGIFDGPAKIASASKTASGWTAGGGIEAALSQNWTAKTEYLYVDAGNADVINVLPHEILSHFANRFHVFRYGVNYHFN